MRKWKISMEHMNCIIYWRREKKAHSTKDVKCCYRMKYDFCFRKWRKRSLLFYHICETRTSHFVLKKKVNNLIPSQVNWIQYFVWNYSLSLCRSQLELINLRHFNLDLSWLNWIILLETITISQSKCSKWAGGDVSQEFSTGVTIKLSYKCDIRYWRSDGYFRNMQAEQTYTQEGKLR